MNLIFLVTLFFIMYFIVRQGGVPFPQLLVCSKFLRVRIKPFSPSPISGWFANAGVCRSTKRSIEKSMRAGRLKPRTNGLTLILGCAAVVCTAWFFLVHNRVQTLNSLAGGSSSSSNQGRRVRGRDVTEIGAEADPCVEAQHKQHTEYWGSVVKAGMSSGKDKGLEADSAATCCMACKDTRGCNIWVWCSNPASCGKQCWLKRVGAANQVQPHGMGDSVPWTSGSVAKDYDRDVASLPPVDATVSVVQLTTPHGPIRIRLKPDWSESSVEFVRRVAMTTGLCTPQCEFYRAEPGFLLQGSLRAFIPPNSKTTPGPKIMERGEIGWAGGSAGPDFFIYLGTGPATHWGHDHTVWGVIADDESMKVVEKIVQLPAEAPKPGDMHMMVEREPFDISVAKQGAR